MTEKARNVTLRDAMVAEEIRLNEKLKELEQTGPMSNVWITVKDALNEIKAALRFDPFLVCNKILMIF